MKALADKLTHYVIRSGAVPEQAYEIYQYGFQIGIEMSVCFIISLGIAVYLHMIPEFIVFITVFILLRTYGGGLHMESFWTCVLCSVIVQTAALLFSSWYQFPLLWAWSIIFICSGMILWLSPVENYNRELEEIEKRHCRKVTLKVIIGIVLFSWYCMVVKDEKMVSLIAVTLLVVLGSQYAGKIKYTIQRRSI